AERLDHRLRVADFVDPPVFAVEAFLQGGGRREDQLRLRLRGVVERRVREGDVGDRVAAQPAAVAAFGEGSFFVEEVVAGGVELAQPAAGELEPRRQIGRLPMVRGRRAPGAGAAAAGGV